MLGRIQVHIDAVRYFFGQRRQLEVMRREQSERAHLFSHVVCGSPRQRQAVEGTRATPDLVHEHQALLGRVVQNRRGLGHFDHERAATARQVVRGADAREYPIDRTESQAFRRDETTDMRQDDDQGGLPHIRRLAAHVRPGNHHQPLPVMQRKIVGDKRRLQHLLDDEMPAATNFEAGFVDDLRLAKIQGDGAVGETDKDVEFCQSAGGLLQAGEPGREIVEDTVVQNSFPAQRTLPCTQDLVFEFLQFRRDVTLRAFQRLASQVVRGGFVGLSFTDLYVVTVHAVIAELQCRDTRAFFLAFLEIDQVLVRIARDRAQVIELIVIAVRDDAALAHEHRWIFNQCFLQQVLFARMVPDLFAKRPEQRRIDIGQRAAYFRNTRQRARELAQVSRPRGAQRDSRQDPLDIADALQRFL